MRLGALSSGLTAALTLVLAAGGGDRKVPFLMFGLPIMDRLPDVFCQPSRNSRRTGICYNSRMRLSGLLLFAVSLLFGCQSYTVVQRNIFADDDGNVVVVDYGRSESEHHNTFISPANGKELDFHSNFMVKVQLPDGDDFKAWECMSFLPPGTGTMYGSDNGEWKALANGFSFSVYHRTGEPPPRDYLEVFRGVLCDIPDREVKKDDRWKDITNAGKGREYRKPPQTAR